MKNTKNNKQKKQVRLTEKRVREIAREEIIKWHKSKITPIYYDNK